MLTRLSNTPRDYAWGSTTLIAELEGRAPSGAPEAEVWFGDHPGSPALVEDGTGRTLDLVLDAQRPAGERLPYLLKILAAASPLSIQVHPSKPQAIDGFAREEALGTPRDGARRNYRDDNHKPEILVALSDRFEALAGLREPAATRRLLQELGEVAEPLLARLSKDDAADALRKTIGWLLSTDSRAEVDALIAALAAAESTEFAFELEVYRRIAESCPGDPGVAVALLLNVVVLRRGEAAYLPAGMLHAYLSGLGVELMAASDNVLRGGLTPKHVDVDELLRIVDTTPGPVPRLAPELVAGGVQRFVPDVPDFALLHVQADEGPGRGVDLSGTAIVLATSGDVTVRGALMGAAVRLRPGQAVLATADESPLLVSGSGEAFVAEPGARGPSESR